MTKLNSIGELGSLRDRILAEQNKCTATLTICGGTGCQATRSLAVVEALKSELERQGRAGTTRLRTTGCHGFCEQGPLIIVEPGDVFYCHVKPDDVGEIISRTLVKGEVIDRLLYQDPLSGQLIKTQAEIPFYHAQNRVLLSQNMRIDPRSIEDYIAIGGYSALAKVLANLTPEETIDVIKMSGLRGRGGGGFPTGRKWEQCRATRGDVKYVVCNGDEGDPGAYMDRSVLEGNPHAVLEGMLIGAFAVGAKAGFIYVRNEYPLAVSNCRVAVDQARELGLLGDGILGSKLSLDVEIARGGGAFVCGESTALMASLEGKVGEPRPKDVHTVESGLWQKPSNLNNVETWANVPMIINRGAKWFASMGTEHSKGTKIFALTGHVKNTGLVEVAMDTTLRKIVFDIGGGANNGTGIKAVQTGGPSGGCLPVSMFDLPVDFEALAKAGSMVGSGGMVAMDERTCMVDVARYFVKFLQDESCGKCVPCRLGLDRMLEILTDISEGRGRPEQIEVLEDLAETMATTSLCALGKTAPNPVLSTLRYFRGEYEAHIRDGRCPAKACRSLIRYEIDADRCNGCGSCLRACPQNAITGEKKKPHRIDADNCIKCGICRDGCKTEAITVN